MKLNSRVAALEAARPAGAGVFHRVIQDIGQSQGEAIAAYGSDRIAPNDRVILRVIVAPNGEGLPCAA